jgi:hypothetical protein
MAKRSKKPRDLNAMAAAIVAQATDEAEPIANLKAEAGRLGGLKGGNARAAKLSKAKRSEIAKKAAAARWAKP